MAIVVRGRKLESGETSSYRLSEPARSAPTADRYAESESRFWLAVDGDGDGRRTVLPDSPVVPVVAAAAARLLLHLPATARPGESVRFTFGVGGPSRKLAGRCDGRDWTRCGCGSSRLAPHGESRS